MPLTSSVDDLYAAAMAGSTTVTSDDPAPLLYTGRYIAILKDDASADAVAALTSTYSLTVASAASFEDQAVDFSDLGAAEVLVFPGVGVALVSPDAYAAITGTGGAAVAADVPSGGTGGPAPAAPPPDSIIASFEPEIFFYVTDDDPPAADPAAADPAGAATSPSVTWGLDVTAVARSNFSGNGIKVCVLDTGFDLSHPEFAGRTIVSKSFVSDPVQDKNSHGTHTAGTACGPQTPGAGIQRYGVAYGSQMYIGKVMTDKGVGVTASIIAGINWALANKCEVVSMSLRAPSPVQPSYTLIGTKALAQGTLLVAATGNDSARPGTINPTGSPANSPSVMAVAGVDSTLHMYVRSNGGKVEIAGPGVDVFSSVPAPALHGTMSGTSMATPHVAGIAALWAESDHTLRGQALWDKLVAQAQPVSESASDVGAGLVQAPTGPGMSQ